MDDRDDVFVTLEGIDGTGKTGVATKVDSELEGLGVSHLVTHDPPRIEPWHQLKKSVLDRQSDIAPLAEAMLYFTGRLDNVLRYILPALKSGQVVIADRYSDSWIAYQTLKLESLFGSRAKTMDWLARFPEPLLRHGLYAEPAKTFLLVADPEEAVERAAKKGPTKWEDPDFLKDVQQIYLDLAAREPDRFRVIDIHGRQIGEAIDEVTDEVIEYVGQQVRL